MKRQERYEEFLQLIDNMTDNQLTFISQLIAMDADEGLDDLLDAENCLDRQSL